MAKNSPEIPGTDWGDLKKGFGGLGELLGLLISCTGDQGSSIAAWAQAILSSQPVTSRCEKKTEKIKENMVGPWCQSTHQSYGPSVRPARGRANREQTWPRMLSSVNTDHQLPRHAFINIYRIGPQKLSSF